MWNLIIGLILLVIGIALLAATFLMDLDWSYYTNVTGAAIGGGLVGLGILFFNSAGKE